MNKDNPLPESKHSSQAKTAEPPCPNNNCVKQKKPPGLSIGRLFKYLLIVASAVTITAILLLTLFISLILGSESSREWLVQDILPKLISSDSIQLTITEFNSPTPSYWYFDSVSLNVNDQNIIHAKKFLINMKLASIFDKKLDITELSAESLFITLPKTNTQKQIPTKAEQSSNWQDMLIPARVQKLTFQHLEINVADLDLPAFQASGKAQLLWQDSLFTSDLFVQSKSTPTARINLQAKFDNQITGTLKASIQEDAGGWLGKTILLPNDQAVDFDLEFSAKTEKSITTWQLHSFKMPWQKHKLNAVARGLWSANEQKLELKQSSIFINNKEQNIKGWWKEKLFELDTTLRELPISLTDAFQDYIVGGNVSGTVLAQGNFSNPILKTNLHANTQFKKQAVSVSLEGEGDFDSFKVEDAFIKLGTAQLKTSGTLFTKRQTMDLQVHQLSGPVRIVEVFDVVFPDDLYIDINKAQGTLIGAFTAPKYTGLTQAKGRYKEQTFEAATKFNGDINKVTLTDFVANTSNSQIKADGLIDWHINQFALELATKKLPLNLISLLNVELPEDISAYIDTDLSLTGAFTAPNYSGKLSATGYLYEHEFKMNTNFKGNVQQIEISEFNSNISEGNIQAAGLIDWQNEQLNLALQASNIPSSLASIAQFELPESLSAVINTKGLLSGSFGMPSYKGEASAKGVYQNEKFDITSVLHSTSESIEITDVSAELVFTNQNNETQASSIYGNGIYTFSSKRLEGKLKVQDLPYSAITLIGVNMPKKLAGILDADLTISGKLPIPIIYGSIKSDGIYEGQPFNFNFSGSQKDKALAFDDTTIIWNDTILSADGSVSKENLNLHVKLKALKLTDLNAFGLDLKPGNIDLNFNLLGSLGAPQLDGLIKLNVKSFDRTEDLNSVPEDIIVTSQFETVNDTLVLTSHVKQGAESRGHLVIRSHFKPFLNWLISDAGEQDITKLPLAISSKGNVGLNWINHFIDRDIQSISGKLILDALLDGSLAQPRLKGSLDLLNGSYENSLSQTSIKEAEIKLAFDEKSINIVKAEATDGHTGEITLNGKVDLADGDNGLIDITLNLNNASIVRREDIEGDVSGRIQLLGDLKNMLLKGDIDITPFQIMLDLIPKDAIPEIEVSIKEEDSKPQIGPIASPNVSLNIQLNVDQQAYIRGRGLDAELKGKLKLTGSMSKPSYNGQFNVIRGSFELFAKTFKLEEGDVLFSNDAVSLFVQGRYKGKDLTFIASLSGTLDDLKIELRTEPSLPEDEALARLLFGRSVRNITPFQAIQLASAIQTMRGEGGKFDPLGTARDILHVDNISIESQETSEGNGIAVGLGKYITEGVYVEIVRTPEPTQPWEGSIEVELTPNINLETTTGGSSGFGGVELQWKKDY